jgi:putative membrane protein
VSHWQPDPSGLALAVLLSAGYLVLVRRAYSCGHRWPLPRTLMFLVPGIGVLLLATAGPVGTYSSQLFSVYVVKVLLLLLVSPTFLAFGRPLTLMRLRPPGTAAAGPNRWLTRLGNPLVGPALVPICTGVVFFTGLLTASLHSTTVADLEQIGLLLVGIVFSLPLAGEGAPPVSIAVAFAVFAGFLELLADALPGFAVRMRNSLLTPWYASLHRVHGPSPINDQHLGGSILWVVAELVDLPFLAFMVVQWIRADAREAAEEDQRLDELAAERKAAATSQPGAGHEDAGHEDAREAPWWERDASVFGSRARQFRR